MQAIEAHYASRTGADDMGSTAEGGVTGTLTLNSFLLVLEPVLQWFRTNRQGSRIGFFDVGSLGGRMLFLAIACLPSQNIERIEFSAGVELKGQLLGRTRGSKMKEDCGLVHRFKTLRRELGLEHRVTAEFGTSVESLRLISVHPSVDHNIFMWLLFEGQDETALRYAYTLAQQEGSGVQVVATVPSKAKGTELGSTSGILKVLGSAWELHRTISVVTMAKQCVKSMHIFTRKVNAA